MKTKQLRTTSLLVSLCLIFLLTAGCAARVKTASETKAEINYLLQYYDNQWATQNQGIISDMGAREVDAPIDLCAQLAEDTLWRLGFTILEDKSTPDRIEARADAPVPFSVAEWNAIRKEVVTDIRRNVPAGYEDAAQYLHFRSKNTETTAVVSTKENSGKSVVSLQLGIVDHNGQYGYYAVRNPPPQALKMAYERFWYYFSRRLDKIMARQTVTEKTM